MTNLEKLQVQLSICYRVQCLLDEVIQQIRNGIVEEKGGITDEQRQEAFELLCDNLDGYRDKDIVKEFIDPDDLDFLEEIECQREMDEEMKETTNETSSSSNLSKM